jgi:hypothetical protein
MIESHLECYDYWAVMVNLQLFLSDIKTEVFILTSPPWLLESFILLVTSNPEFQ